MAGKFDLTELFEARRGLPNEAKAARTVAMYAVIPAAILGLLGGTQLIDDADPETRLLWVCSATAFGSGFAVLGLAWMVYKVFGFGPVVLLADTLIGGFSGLFLGASLGHLFDSWWPMVLGPLGGAAALLLSRATSAGRTGPPSEDPPSQPLTDPDSPGTAR